MALLQWHVVIPLGFLFGGTPAETVVYPKKVLSSGQLAVTVYLPDYNLGYHRSTRFEWGSMIGDITMGDTEFFSDLWRSPADPNWGKDHDPTNPEAVLGLASEFGCGSDGPDCPAGWGTQDPVSNGLLGYHEAGVGEPFLKIGVGKLIKGSCDICQADTNYHFNSRYDFAEPPVWTVTYPSNDSIRMAHTASLGPWGYSLQRQVQVDGAELVIKSQLSNTGSETFSTVQYTHNFLAFDGKQIEPPFKMRFGQDPSKYAEPPYEHGWSVPLASHFTFSARNTWSSSLPLPVGGSRQSILTFFEEEANLNSSNSYFAQNGRAAVVSLTRTASGTQQTLYGYKFFAQATAACPEPLQQIQGLAPGQSVHWEQRLAFSLLGASTALSKFFRGIDSAGGKNHECVGEKTAVSDTNNLRDCMAQCLLRLNCQGLEFSKDSSACEILIGNASISSKEKKGYMCLQLDPPQDQLTS